MTNMKIECQVLKLLFIDAIPLQLTVTTEGAFFSAVQTELVIDCLFKDFQKKLITDNPILF